MSVQQQTLSVIAGAAIIALNYNYTTHNRARFKYSLLILIRDKNRFGLEARYKSSHCTAYNSEPVSYFKFNYRITYFVI